MNELIQFSSSRSPIEIGIDCIKWLPSNSLKVLERKYGSIQRNAEDLEDPANIWFSEREETYACIGTWLAAWTLGMESPTGERAALYSPIATTFDSFFNLCKALYYINSAEAEVVDDAGWIRLACVALMSDFLSQIADSGAGYRWGVPGYPPALEEGKSEGRRRMVSQLRYLGAKPGNRSELKRGRPKGFTKQNYPSECCLFNQTMMNAQAIARSNKEFRDGVYAKYLKDLSAANTHCDSKAEFQVGFVTLDNSFFIGGKGKHASQRTQPFKKKKRN